MSTIAKISLLLLTLCCLAGGALTLIYLGEQAEIKRIMESGEQWNMKERIRIK